MLQQHFLMPEVKSPHLKLTGRRFLKNLGLGMTCRKTSLLRRPSLSVELASVEPFAPAVHLQQITLSTPPAGGSAGQAGKINLLNLVQTDKNPPGGGRGQTAGGRGEKKKPLVFSIDRPARRQGGHHLHRRTAAQPVRLSLSPLTLIVVSAFRCRRAIRRPGSGAGSGQKDEPLRKGPFGIDPLAADLALE
jgi:hypothetical protein